MIEHIRHSNLIELIDDPAEDKRSLEAWEWLVEKPNITYKRLMHLHRVITLKQLPDNQAGAYRTVMVKVGYYMPPSPVLVKPMMDEWLYDMLKPSERDPRGMHIRFEKIHPFIDGNGRVGRMLMWWHEVKLGLEPTLIRVEEKQNYYQWFNEG